LGFLHPTAGIQDLRGQQIYKPTVRLNGRPEQKQRKTICVALEKQI